MDSRSWSTILELSCSVESKREAFYFITSRKTFDRDASDLSLFEW